MFKVIFCVNNFHIQAFFPKLLTGDEYFPTKCKYHTMKKNNNLLFIFWIKVSFSELLHCV